MKKLALLVGLFAVLGSQPREDAAKKDLEAMQGMWAIAGLEVNGMEVPVNKLQGTTLNIKGADYVVVLKDKKLPVVLQLDPAKDPKEMDMIFSDGVNKDKVHKAIYKIDNDMLIICRGLNPEQDRPREFATWPNTNYFVVKWKKQ